MCQMVFVNLLERASSCLANEGGHFEHAYSDNFFLMLAASAGAYGTLRVADKRGVRFFVVKELLEINLLDNFS